VCPRPLARSDSENVYEAIPDVRDPPREDTLEQVAAVSRKVRGEAQTQGARGPPEMPTTVSTRFRDAHFHQPRKEW
jgi:hypothetical protein